MAESYSERLQQIGETARAHMEETHAAREAALAASRKAIQLSSRSIRAAQMTARILNRNCEDFTCRLRNVQQLEADQPQEPVCIYNRMPAQLPCQGCDSHAETGSGIAVGDGAMRCRLIAS